MFGRGFIGGIFDAGGAQAGGDLQPAIFIFHGLAFNGLADLLGQLTNSLGGLVGNNDGIFLSTVGSEGRLSALRIFSSIVSNIIYFLPVTEIIKSNGLLLLF